MSHTPKVGVIAVVWRWQQVLLVKRKYPPHAGHWGFPGGKLEWGETMAAGAARELLEETGVVAEMEAPFACFDVLAEEDGRLAHHYVMVAVRGHYQSGIPVAADDALAVDWFSPGALPSPLCPDLELIIERSLNCHPRAGGGPCTERHQEPDVYGFPPSRE